MTDIDPHASMPEATILDNIGELEPGWEVAFRAGDARKLEFSYTVDAKQGTTTKVSGPKGGDWRFEIASGTPKLIFVSPTRGECSKGSLDYLKGRSSHEGKH